MNQLLANIQCQQILQNRFQTQNIKLIDYKLKPISEHPEGYMGEHYNLTITYEQNGKTLKDILFMKRKSTNETQIKVANEARMYEKEILFYDVLLRNFESKGYDTSFSPKSYFCIPGEAIVLENLLIKDYKLLKRNHIFDMTKIKCLLKALALYHGAGFAYETTKSLEMGKKYRFTDDYGNILQEQFFCQFLKRNPLSMEYWEGCNKTISSLIKVLPKDEEYIKEFLDLFLNYPTAKVFADETKFAKTCGHGDLWSNNMMFKFDGDIPTKCCLVDFQIVRYFYPAFDVVLSIYGNTDAEFRKKHLQDSFEYYYDTLADVMKNYGHELNNIMTKDDFYKTINLVKPDCLFQVATTDVIIFLPKEELTNSVHKNDDSFEKIMFDNSDISVKLFKENEPFRKKITGILYEIYDALVTAKKENI